MLQKLMPGLERTDMLIICYLQFLLCSLRKSSRAIVIEGAFGLGAFISSRNPSCSTALAVVGPKAAILISPWTKSGKFSFNDLMPEGL
jgi:hypothetical protein